ncbi:MAG TPA: VCBS repeat-containing protein [Fimbriiglobus sp.]
MTAPPRRFVRFGIAVVVLLVVAGGLALALYRPTHPLPDMPPLPPEPPEASSEDVHRMCSACHAYPPPDTFPRADWRKEVAQAFNFFHQDLHYRFAHPPLESVVRYYEARAPESLPFVPPTGPTTPPVRFDKKAFLAPNELASKSPGVANVALGHLFHKDKTDVIVCDSLNKQVLVFKPYETEPEWMPLVKGLTCVHAEVVDLDGDGIPDVILACIGDFYANDHRVGSVVWLKGAADGSFTPITLIDGLGRVADVRAANFMGSGKLDLVVAEFGWHVSGSILLLENQTTDWSHPKFVSHVLDDRHGTTHVPVADMNGDGKPDFVACISQEHETVVAFINEGGGKFKKETVFTAPQPTYGSNGVVLADVNNNGKIDVVYTNGDSLDSPFLLRPEHGITWLENKGTYPFTPHRLADCYGAVSPVVADFDCNGLPDIAFVTFLPGDLFPQRAELKLDAVVLLSQTSPGKFVRHALETVSCDHLTCAAGDWSGSGRPDLVIGNYVKGGRPGPIVKMWKNLGKP